ncbi:MAG: RhuM family protein [Isosphaeraceae bacterium]|nr:RhuM family protein [Isosphaeraceae bacterium]
MHGHTAAEVVHERADASKLNMGLTTWKNAPKGKIRKTDVCIAKNYLTEDELAALNRVVTMYLDYAEDQAQRRKSMHMTDWVHKLDDFLEFTERNILTHVGKVSHQLAEEHAHREFDMFEAERRRIEATQPTSDFDRAVEDVKRLEAEQKAIPKKKTPKRKKPGEDAP